MKKFVQVLQLDLFKVNSKRYRDHNTNINLMVLKKLRNCILRIVRVWSLFCSIRVYGNLHFYLSFGKLVFHLTAFSVFRIRCYLHRSSLPGVLIGKGILKIYSKFTGEHPCQSVISIKLLCRCSPVNLLHIFRTPFYKNIH